MTDFSLAAPAWTPADDCSDPTPPLGDGAAPSDDLRLFLESTRDCVILVDADWRLTFANHHARHHLPSDGEGVRGRRLWDVFPHLVGTRFESEYRRSMATRSPCTFQARIESSGTWYDLQCSPLPNGGLGIWFRDISAQKESEEKWRAAEERYRLAAMATDGMVWDLDLASGRIDWTASIRDRLGYDLPDFRSSIEWWEERVHPEDRERALRELAAVVESGAGRFACEYRFRRPDGTYADVLDRGFVMCDTAGTPVRMVGAMQDNSERNSALAALRARESQLATIFGQAMVGILHCNLSGEMLMVNNRYCEIVGRSEADLHSRAYTDYTHPDDVEWTRALFRRQAETAEPYQIEKRYVRPDGSVVWCAIHVSFVRDEDGEAESCIVVVEDITGARETAEQLRRASEEDPLTGLPNRRSFQAHLQAATFRAMRSGSAVGLLLLDLDHFKHVNDTLGHAAGDHLLKTFADRVRGSARPTDFVARLGGDEFAVVLENVSGAEDLLAVGSRIGERLRKPTRFDGRLIGGTVTIGGAVFPEDAGNAHELFKNADTALYALKAAGRGGTKMFHSHMRERAQQVSSQLSLARIALSEKSVVPFYQPKVRLADGRLDGFEALLRWHHPRQGIQYPETIAEAFKDYQLASAIGELMQAAVVDDIKAWTAAGVDFGRISINAAPAEFLRDDYSERLLALLDREQVPASLIEIEVTEHVFLDRGSDYVGRALAELTRAGVRIALDDFGTGYSSLSHLRDFPVDVVKIDRSFIERMLDDSEIAAIVTAVVNLARSLSLEVVAEGIEREEQRCFLREQGCTFGQGYLFGAAVQAEQVARIAAGR
jgi:diguanylate cyclase (GGDEF)-like protein/PAS domain S-box-containing protein